VRRWWCAIRRRLKSARKPHLQPKKYRQALLPANFSRESAWPAWIAQALLGKDQESKISLSSFGFITKELIFFIRGGYSDRFHMRMLRPRSGPLRPFQILNLGKSEPFHILNLGKSRPFLILNFENRHLFTYEISKIGTLAHTFP